MQLLNSVEPAEVCGIGAAVQAKVGHINATWNSAALKAAAHSFCCRTCS